MNYLNVKCQNGEELRLEVSDGVLRFEFIISEKYVAIEIDPSDSSSCRVSGEGSSLIAAVDERSILNIEDITPTSIPDTSGWCVCSPSGAKIPTGQCCTCSGGERVCCGPVP